MDNIQNCYVLRILLLGRNTWQKKNALFSKWETTIDRLCGLVVRVIGYRSGGPGSIPGIIKKKK
jgi:hypothetical protein